MPRMDKTGPEGKGSFTGRRLGSCRSDKSDWAETGNLGTGLGKRFHVAGGNCSGKGKRLRYFQDKKL
jgi:hypothetical protein